MEKAELLPIEIKYDTFVRLKKAIHHIKIDMSDIPIDKEAYDNWKMAERERRDEYNCLQFLKGVPEREIYGL